MTTRSARTVGSAAALMLTLAIGAGVAGCASSGVNQGDFNLISLDEEWQLGRQLAADVGRQVRLLRDPTVEAYVDEVGHRIVAPTEMGRLPWRFHVIDDPDINAFNIPGGHVFVNTGLIARAPDAAAFTGALAHEISHGVARHSTEQLSRAYGIEILGSVALGQNPAVYQQILASLLAQGALARYSRAAESEADNLGVRYMARAGYDPRGMVEIFQTLLAERRRRPGAVQQFFSSHPLTEDRLAAVQQEISRMQLGADLVRDEPAFDRVQTRVGR